MHTGVYTKMSTEMPTKVEDFCVKRTKGSPRIRSGPGKPKKGQFMNFSRGRSGTKVRCESCLFSKGKTPEFTKMGEIHELFVLALSLVWFAGATPERRLLRECSREIFQCSRKCTRKWARSVFTCPIFTCFVSCRRTHLLIAAGLRRLESRNSN